MRFPTISKKQDSQYFSMKQDDPAIRAKAEGGYEFSRPRFTRRPRRTFTTGFSYITDDDRAVLEQFWNDVKGGSHAFDWEHPISKELILVRFTKPIDYAYAGVGRTYLWHVKMELKEV